MLSVFETSYTDGAATNDRAQNQDCKKGSVYALTNCNLTAQRERALSEVDVKRQACKGS